MGPKDYPIEYFYNEFATEFYFFFSNVTAVLTIALAPIHIYTILTQSKKMGSYKWFLLNHSVWCIMLEIFLAITKPIPLYPAASYVSANAMFPDSISPGTLVISYGIFQLILILAVGGVSMSLVYRYGNVFPGFISRIIASKKSMYVYISGQFSAVALIFIIGHSLPSVDRISMISMAVTQYPALIAFTNESTFAYFDKGIIRIAVIISLFTMILLPVLFAVFSGLLIYKVKSTNFQTLNYASQLTLIHSVIAQVVVTVLFLFLPILPASLSIIFEIP
ncbi:hypothetical protein FO519_008176, partial [Halicephalobus sp. NKZ332]